MFIYAKDKSQLIEFICVNLTSASSVEPCPICGLAHHAPYSGGCPLLSGGGGGIREE